MRGFSEMARPLRQMTRAGVEWDWSEAQHQAFNRLKLALTTAPVLKLQTLRDSLWSPPMRVTQWLVPFWSRTSAMAYNRWHLLAEIKRCRDAIQRI